MQANRIVHAIDSHTCGETTRLVVSGVPLQGKTVLEQREYMREHFDGLRSMLMNEPRGHRGMFGGILTRSALDGVDFGIIWIDNGGYLNMSGASSIGVGITLVEAGLVAVTEPITNIRLEVPAGIVEIAVTVEDGRAVSAALTNVPAFLYARDLELTLDTVGKVTFDISFGGNFFGVVSAPTLGLQVNAADIGQLSEIGVALRQAINRQVQVRHPTQPHIDSVDLVTFYEPPTAEGAKYRATHVFADGQFDRSPGGTGVSHMVARLVARGEMRIDEVIIAEGILGSVFEGRVVKPTKVGNFDAVVPQVRGTAYVTGFHQFVVDPADPLADGFLI